MQKQWYRTVYARYDVAGTTTSGKAYRMTVSASNADKAKDQALVAWARRGIRVTTVTIAE